MPTLEITQELLDKLNNGESITIEPPKKKIELEKLSYCFTNAESMNRDRNNFPIQYGRYRKTVEACELARKRMNKMNPLSQLAHQLGGEKEFEKNIHNYCVQYSHNFDKYVVNCATDAEIIGAVYMTQKCAIEIRELLNGGEFEL